MPLLNIRLRGIRRTTTQRLQLALRRAMIHSRFDRRMRRFLRSGSNPCRDRIVLQLPDAGINRAEVEIYDIMGKLLFSGPLEVSGRKTVNFNLPAAILDHKGIFVLRLNTNILQYTSKVIKW